MTPSPFARRALTLALAVATLGATLPLATPASAQARVTPPLALWVRGVRLNVTDMEKSIAFYRDLVGMKLMGRFGTGTELEQAVFTPMGKMRHDDTIFVISKDATVKKIDPSAVGWVSVWVPSVDEAAARVRAAGYPITTEPVNNEQEQLRRSYVKDPDGFSIELLNFVVRD